MYLAPKNCFLRHFWELQKIKLDFSATFLQFHTVYYIKYYKRQLEESSLKIPFSYLQFRKKPEKAILWSQIHFWRKNKIFLNVARFACKHFWAYSKLVWTPCMTIMIFWSFPKKALIWCFEINKYLQLSLTKIIPKLSSTFFLFSTFQPSEPLMILLFLRSKNSFKKVTFLFPFLLGKQACSGKDHSKVISPTTNV